jgi:hypothetical protein
VSVFEVARGDVVFEAQTGAARLGIDELRATFAKATAGMSDDALKLAAATERRDVAIARSNGKVTRSTVAAELELRKLTSTNTQTVASSNAASGAFAREGAEINRLGRGALVGSGLVRGLGRAAAFSSTAFLGGAGLVFAIRTATNAAQEHAVREGQLRTAITAAGISYRAYRSTIDEAIAAQERLGFSEEDSIKGFTKIVVATQDVERATRLQGLAADIARKFNVDLAVAANAVARAVGGQTGALRRIDPSIKAGVSSAKALQQAEHDLAGSAEDYAKRAAGAHDRASTAIEHEEILIGQGLIPIRRRLDDAIATYLGKASNQRKIQEAVNKAIKDGTAIVHGFVDAERLVAPPIEKIVGALGGLEHAVEDALIIGIVLKARKAAASFGLIQAASAKTATVIAADAAVEEKAIAGVGATAGVVAKEIAGAGAVAGGGAAAGLLSGAGLAALLKRGGSKALGFAGKGLTLAALVELLQGATKPQQPAGSTWSLGGIAHAVEHPLADIQSVGTALAVVAGLAKPPAKGDSKQAKLTWTDVFPLIRSGVLTAGAVRNLRDRFATTADYNGALAYAQQLAGGKPSVAAIPASASGTAQNPYYISPAQQREINLAANPQSVSALTAQRDYDTRAIAFLKKRFAAGKIDAKSYAQALIALENDRVTQEGQITSIEQAAAAKVAEARNKREAAARKRAAEAKAAAAKARSQYRTGLSTEAETLQNEVLRERKAGSAQTHVVTTSTGGVRITGPAISTATGLPGERKLIDFYKKEATDKRLTENERARYAHLALTEEDRATKAIQAENKRRQKLVADRKKVLAERLKTESDLGDAILQNALAVAQLHETQAGTNAAALKKARGEELKALQAQLAQEKLEEKALTGKGNELARQQKISEEIATRSAIAQLHQQDKPTVDRGANERQFLSSFQDIVSKYAPNAFPAPSNAKMETHLFNAVHELRHQTRALTGLIGHDAFPASRYADRTAAAVAG